MWADTHDPHSPLQAGRGAILFLSANSEVGAVHPVLAAVCGLVLAGGTHVARMAARPVSTATTGGFARLPPAAMRAREDAMVRRLSGHAQAVIILGGAHDLSASVRALAPQAEYVRVTLRAYHHAPR